MMMRYPLLLLIVISLLGGCSESENEPRQKTYYLYQANYNPVNGKVVFSELSAGKLQVDIILQNTSEGVFHPAHLHFGDITEVGELAYALNPVDGATGQSTTILDQVALTGGELFTYDLLTEMNGSVKVHMNSSYFSKMVLAFGNIGKNQDDIFEGVAVCTGH
ncbi:hypothetical protein [Marinoscillum sp. MHG1-6]|uniref:hypothetical protein n=1 Tax=Marinoscillum sp. MHG1-6 TaxID=2959627 RepID=UPI0021574FAC|nr:hypothetical protein [Marinoscillum sp. MHG1-6]